MSCNVTLAFMLESPVLLESDQLFLHSMESDSRVPGMAALKVPFPTAGRQIRSMRIY